jgi:hypothetical protein
MSKNSLDHMKMMTLGKQLKSFMKRFDTVLKRNAQLETLGKEVKLGLAEAGIIRNTRDMDDHLWAILILYPSSACDQPSAVSRD